MSAKAEHGFSLIELIVALAVLGIVVLSLFELFAQIRQINRSANNFTTATQLAQQSIELYRNTPYANINLGTKDLAASLTPYPALKSPRTATATVSQIDINGLKQVDVQITYQDRSGPKQIQLSTIVALKGINR